MSKQSISELKILLEAGPLNGDLLAELKKDTRKGVQQLLLKIERKQFKEQELREKFKKMSMYEDALFTKGFKWIAGIDEAGRGPLAGPVVAAAVILPDNFELIGLDDSKQVSEKQREEFELEIKAKAISYKVTAIHNEEIDRINIFEATKKAMSEAIYGLAPRPDHCLIDAVRLPELPCPFYAIEKGDALSISIAAASVLAKTERDRMMKALHDKYPQYDFASNMGYGTPKHMESLKKHGPSPYHRKSFAPVTKAMNISAY